MTVVQERNAVETLHQLYEHSLETFQHSLRVGDLLYQFGDFLQLPLNSCRLLYELGAFHDIGKLYIPRTILEKKGKLTLDEYETIKQHTSNGKQILSSMEFPSEFTEIILYHHENFDGTGYFKVKGEHIPYYASMIRIIDSFDTMFTGRHYQKGISLNLIINEILECSKKQFEPRLVKKFIRFLKTKYSFNHLD